MTDQPETLFVAATPLQFTVRTTRAYWQFIIEHKHPAMSGRETEVEEALVDPDEVRRSRRDSEVYLFCRGGPPRWVCAVARRAEPEGFLITAYLTDAVKAGERIWERSK